MASDWIKRNPDKMQAINQNRRARREFLIAGAKISGKEWVELKYKYGNSCAYCGVAGKMTMDHVIPLSKGGPHRISNIVPACISCNVKKGTKLILPVMRATRSPEWAS